MPVEAPSGPGTVQVICGALTDTVAATGMTIANVRAMFGAGFNVDPRAATLVNGRPVSSRHRLAAGDVLEFLRETGEKGGV